MRLRAENVPVVDSFTLFGATEVPATVSFDVTWKAFGEARHLRPGSSDPTSPFNFAAKLFFATSTGLFSGRNSEGFTFQASNATSDGSFAEMGVERNGVFLQKDDDDDDRDDDKK